MGLLVPDAHGPGSGPLEPFELALKADLVVEGVVTDFERDRAHLFHFLGTRPVFELELTEVVAGFPPAGVTTIEVEQFLDRSQVARYAPYERGQRAIFFLRRPRDADGQVRADRPWLVLGSEGEGECPVVAASGTGEARVLFRGHGLDRTPPIATSAFGHHFRGRSAPRGEFLAMVRGLRRCFEWEAVPRSAGGPFPLETLRRTCTEAELRAFMNTSELARAVVRDSSARAAMHETAGP